MSTFKNTISIQDIALIGLMSATLTAGKFVLASIPNVHIITFLYIIYTISFGIKKTLLASFIFTIIEPLIYGFGTWILGYLFIWPLLIIVTGFLYFRLNIKSEYVYATLAGLSGLFFGLYFAAVESIFYGFFYGVSYWLRGILFDIIHGVSNFIITLLLFKPVIKTFKSRYKKISKNN